MMPAPAPVRIAFCITGLEIGGAERSLVDLVTRLSPRRFAPVVMSLAPPAPGREPTLAQELQAAGIEVEFLNAHAPMQAPAVIWRLARRLKRHRPRILQAFLFHANVAGAIAGRLAGVPHIVAGIRVAERRANLHRWMARRTSALLCCHVCVSQSVADFAHQMGGLPADRLVVIPGGVDPDRYPANPPARLTDLGLAAGRRAILYVGRLTRQKGVDWLLQRAAAILERLPNHDLLLVGRGEEQRRLEQLAAQLRIAQRVHFVGWRGDVPQIMAAGDLLVLSSRWEGMPHVVLEAMASGKPVVATEVEGMAELLGKAKHGQLVGQNDGEGFVDAVVAMATDRARAVAFGQRNRQRVAEAFGIDRTVAAYERLYRSLLAPPRTGPGDQAEGCQRSPT